jgi:hypothetical protein
LEREWKVHGSLMEDLWKGHGRVRRRGMGGRCRSDGVTGKDTIAVWCVVGLQRKGDASNVVLCRCSVAGEGGREEACLGLWGNDYQNYVARDETWPAFKALVRVLCDLPGKHVRPRLNSWEVDQV